MRDHHNYPNFNCAACYPLYTYFTLSVVYILLMALL